MTSHRGTVVALLAGVAALVLATLAGWNDGWLDGVVRPPLIVRAALVAGFTLLGVALLARAATRIADVGAAHHPGRDLPGMVRAVRYAFLAVAAFAAAAGWLLGHPLPIIVALLIAAVDVLETSFLLIVVALGGRTRSH